MTQFFKAEIAITIAVELTKKMLNLLVSFCSWLFQSNA